jgi:hypothetical protein
VILSKVWRYRSINIFLRLGMKSKIDKISLTQSIFRSWKILKFSKLQN